MPCIFLHYTEGTFEKDALDKLVAKITRCTAKLEKLPLTDFILSTTWVYCREYPKDMVYHGGKSGGNNIITLEVNVIQGGYSNSPKTELIKSATDAIEEHGNLPQGEPRRVYVVIREVEESNWGFDGQPIDLEMLRDPPKDASPL